MATASKTRNAGHALKMNNLFRKRVIEKGVLEAKLDSVSREKAAGAGY
jgi:hypothetical protein